VTVTLVGGPNVTQDRATLVFKQGEVDVAGIQASNPFQLVVTGGTGRFQNARGQATVQTLPGKGNRAGHAEPAALTRQARSGAWATMR